MNTSELFLGVRGIFDTNELAVKIPKYYPEWFNPVYRDILIILVAAILASAAIVTVGFMVITQVSGKS